MKINRFQLDNGLVVLHHEVKNSQMVTVNVLYKVGSRNESPEHTGFAHLFEHLMFGGSVNVPDYDLQVQLASGDNNAFTTNDYTNFYINLPAPNIETAFWLESDRMLSLAFTPQSLEVQRSVVIEEFKQRCINQPYGDTGHLIADISYKVHPYRWPTIGLELSHIESATMDDVKSFFYRYYAPNNAILSVVGNVSLDEVRRLADKWFASIPYRDIDTTPIPAEPPHLRQRRRTVRRNVPNQVLYMTFGIGSRSDADFPVWDMLSDILSNGRSSWFYRNLVVGQHLFTSIDAFVQPRTDGGELIIAGMPAGGVQMADAEAAVWRLLDKLKATTLSESELDKLKNKFETSDATSNMDNENIASNLAYWEMAGDAELINQQTALYRAVDAKKVKREARRILTRKNSNVLWYLPKE